MISKYRKYYLTAALAFSILTPATLPAAETENNKPETSIIYAAKYKGAQEIQN